MAIEIQIRGDGGVNQNGGRRDGEKRSSGGL